MLVLSGYFDMGAAGQKNLYLSQQGEIVEVVLDTSDDGALVARYQEMSVGDNWNPYDQLVFLDLAEIQPVVAPLAAPLLGSLGGLAAGGAALVAGGVVIAGGGDGYGYGYGDAVTVIQPTVNEPEATHLVGDLCNLGNHDGRIQQRNQYHHDQRAGQQLYLDRGSGG